MLGPRLLLLELELIPCPAPPRWLTCGSHSAPLAPYPGAGNLLLPLAWPRPPPVLPAALGPLPPRSHCPSCVIPLSHVAQTLLEPNRGLLQPLHPPQPDFNIAVLLRGASLAACSSSWVPCPCSSFSSSSRVGGHHPSSCPVQPEWGSLVSGGRWRLAGLHVIMVSSARGFSSLQSHRSSSAGTQHGANEGNCSNLLFLKWATQLLWQNGQDNLAGGLA